MRRAPLFVAPLAGALALGMAFPAIATAAPVAQPPTVSFSASRYSVSEAAGHATITATRHGAGRAVTVNFATHWGTALVPRDYTTTVRTLTIPAGTTTTAREVQVPVKDNSVANADRTFTVTLNKPSRYTLASPSTAKVLIVNDDAPVAPSGLTASPVGTDEIDLAWTANTDYVTGYQVWRSTTAGGPYTSAGSSATNSYSDTGLAAGSYYYVVQALNPAGSSPNSGEATATVGPTQTELIDNGGFEHGLDRSWFINPGTGATITLETTAPHSGTNFARLASDGSQATDPSMQGSFVMPSTGTVTFTAWYRAALAASDSPGISLYDYNAGTSGEYISIQNPGSAADWTQTTPVVLDASTRAGHLILVGVDLQGSGVSSFDVDDFSAVVG